MIDEARFWSKVDRQGPDECWPWVAHRNAKGYGEVGVSGRTRKAHRVAYELLVGPIPESLTLDHLCRNRACVNPVHLEPVTNRENILRSPISPTAINARKTHCDRGHPLSGENLYLPPDGQRECRTCRREHHRAEPKRDRREEQREYQRRRRAQRRVA